MTSFIGKLFATLVLSTIVHEGFSSNTQMKEYYNFPRIHFKEKENGKYIARQTEKYRRPCYFCNTTVSNSGVHVPPQSLDIQCASQNKENLDNYEVSENMLPFCHSGLLPSCDRRGLPKFENGYWKCSNYEVFLIDQFGHRYCGAFLKEIPVYSKCTPECSQGFFLLEWKEIRCDETRQLSPSPFIPFCKKLDISSFTNTLKGDWFQWIGNFFKKRKSDELSWKLKVIDFYLEKFEEIFQGAEENVALNENRYGKLEDNFQTIKMELEYAKNSRLSASKNLDKVIHENHASKPVLTMLRALESTLYAIESIESTVWSMDIDYELIEEMDIKLEDIEYAIQSAQETIKSVLTQKFPKWRQKLISERHRPKETVASNVDYLVVAFPGILFISALLIITVSTTWVAITEQHVWYILGRYSEDSFSFGIISNPSDKDLESIYPFSENGHMDVHSLALIGGEGKLLTTSKIKEELKKRKTATAVCVVLDLEEKQGVFKLTSTSRLALWLPLETKEYWSVVPPEGYHKSWSEYNTYHNLKDLRYINETIEIFEQYTTRLHDCTKVSDTLIPYHFQNIVVYPGTYQRTETPTIAVCSYDEVKNYSTDVIEILRNFNVAIDTLGNKTIEIRRINKYLNMNPQGRPSKHIQFLIEDVEENLMIEHSNLNAISSSRVKSKRQGLEITKEECIVLYCTCKGIIPLLEKKFPTEINGFPVDVREGYGIPGTVKGIDYCDPLLIGCSVGTAGRNSTGSVGPFVKETISGNAGFLSCAHVYHDIPLPPSCYFQQQQNVFVVQPSDQDKGQLVGSRICGILMGAFIGNVYVKGQHIGTDVAYVRQSSRIPYSPAFPCVSQQQEQDNGYIKFPTIGDEILDLDEDDQEHLVYKCGRSSGFTNGKVNTTYGSVKRYSDSGNVPAGRFFIHLKHLYEIRNIGSDALFFELGDSGSGVYIKKKKKFCLIGIAIALSNLGGDLCYVSPISAAIEALKKDNIHVAINKFDVQPMDEN